MATGMWTAVSGASAQAQNLETIANNLANTDTPAFKKDLPTFKEYLTTIERTHDQVDIPRGPIKDKDFYPLDGRDQSFVVNDGSYTSYQQGTFRVTHSQFDVGLDGPGFFEVSTPQGIRYTRFGSFKVAPDGRLVTSQGYPVLMQQAGGLATGNTALSEAENAAARTFNLNGLGSQFSITQEGEIFAGNQSLGFLSVVEFGDLKKLKKHGDQLFQNLDPGNKTAQRQTIVHQGMIETSNVNPVEEMTQMIKANRLFEADLKALKTFGELMGKEVNEVGKL